MVKKFRTLEGFLKRQPSLHSSSDEIEEIPVSTTANLVGINKESRSEKKQTQFFRYPRRSPAKPFHQLILTIQ